MSTHLYPVAHTFDEARGIAAARLKQNAQIPWWDIRKGFDGYYVVPPAELGQGRWGHSIAYECLGNFVERVARPFARDPRGRLPGEMR